MKRKTLYTWRQVIFWVALLMLTCCSNAEKRTIPSRSHSSCIFRPNEAEAFNFDDINGQIIKIDHFGLSKAGAEWYFNGSVSMSFVNGKDSGFYRLKPEKDIYPMVMSRNKFPLKLNRDYLVSMLIRCDFNSKDEIVAGIRQSTEASEMGYSVLYNLNELPNKTDGWVRYEYRLTSYATNDYFDAEKDKSIESNGLFGQFYLRFFPANLKESPFPAKAVFEIADVTIIELPPVPLPSFAKGQGVSFAGGPGKLPMRIESACEKNKKEISVSTTGSEYDFDLEANTITACQRLVKQRKVLLSKLSLSMKDLRVLRQSEVECVLSNENMTIGIQCDGLMLIVPHKELALSCQSEIQPDYERIIAGNILAIDEIGGFSINPAIPVGSGRTARFSWKTLENGKLWDWQLSSGERLGISVFPPRPYDWEKSFQFIYTNVYRSLGLGEEICKKWKGVVSSGLIWSITYIGGGWVGSYGIPIYHYEADLIKDIAGLKAAGIKPLQYLSPYFYYTHDPETYIKDLIFFKNKYGFEGVYFDGNSSQDWLLSYELSRMTRAVYPEGDFIIHTTGQAYNGGPPLARPDIFIPVIDTYATATLRGEFLPHDTYDWQYPKYICSQYRKANCIGIMKADRWKVGQNAADFINLIYNGRARFLPARDDSIDGFFKKDYLPILRQLEQVWKKHGDKPDFYENYYLPSVIRLTSPILEKLIPGFSPEKIITIKQ